MDHLHKNMQRISQGLNCCRCCEKYLILFMIVLIVVVVVVVLYDLYYSAIDLIIFSILFVVMHVSVMHLNSVSVE